MKKTTVIWESFLSHRWNKVGKEGNLNWTKLAQNVTKIKLINVLKANPLSNNRKRLKFYKLQAQTKKEKSFLKKWTTDF